MSMPTRCTGCGQENRERSTYCIRCGAALDLSSPDDDALLGRVLADRYRVVAVIGEGGMGRVYEAEQSMGTATRRVAVKVLHATHSRDETIRRRFHRECDVVAHLSHPNTIQFYDFGELEDGRLYIVMEHIEGTSLRDELRSGPMPLARVERLLVQIAGSLSEAHTHGVVHRDLKPDNILLTTRGGEHDVVKVCDFGIAKRATTDEASPQLTMQGTVIGTPQYMSPEQLTGGEVDSRSDIYSLGLIVYEMLTGTRPFHATSTVEWAARHITSEPPSLDTFEATRGLPEEKKRAVMRALAKLPSERPRTAREFAAELLDHGDASDWTRAPTPSAPVRAVVTPTAAVDVTAPTHHASPTALRRREEPETPTTAPTLLPGKRPPVLALAAALGALGLLGGGASLVIASGVLDGPGAMGEPDAGQAIGASDAALGHAHDRELVPSDWLRIVHFQRRVGDAAHALGPPDGQHAVVRPNGTLVLELAAGTRIATDETPGPDFFVAIDEARSGAYRLDVGVAQNRYTTVGSELIGSLPLDADQFDIRRIRYVRIKNRGTRDLYVDAVGVYRTAAMDPRE